jgi:hypothetical protein
MKKAYEFSWALYNGVPYPYVTLTIDDDIREVGISYERKYGILSRKTINLAKFNYDAKTKIALQNEVLSVDALRVRFDDQRALAEAMELLYKPRQEALLRAEMALDEVKTAIKGFLTKREEALCTLRDIRADPRGMMLRMGPMVPDDAEDPVEWILLNIKGELQQAMKNLKGLLDAELDLLGQIIVEMVFALVYGLGLYLDYIYLKDEARGEGAKELISNLGCKLPFPPEKDTIVLTTSFIEGMLDEGMKQIMDQNRKMLSIIH